jgi:hypothetical protein
MGVRLFDGYAATPSGETAATVAARFADEVLSLERRLSGQDLRPSGTVRIATTDTVSTIVMPHLAAPRVAHPEIRLEITISNAIANLTRREADIAIRPTPEPAETLVGRRIADIAHAIYGSPAYLSGHASKDLLAHDWIGVDDALAGTVRHWPMDARKNPGRQGGVPPRRAAALTRRRPRRNGSRLAALLFRRHRGRAAPRGAENAARTSLQPLAADP